MTYPLVWCVCLGPIFLSPQCHGAMQAGAEVDSKADNGMTPLSNAASNGHVECADQLLRVCVTCSCVALPCAPSADQVTLFCLFVSFAAGDRVSIPNPLFGCGAVVSNGYCLNSIVNHSPFVGLFRLVVRHNTNPMAQLPILLECRVPRSPSSLMTNSKVQFTCPSTQAFQGSKGWEGLSLLCISNHIY